MTVLIKTHNLTKKYGEQRAVHDLSITVKRGEIYGFLGRNGAGKTTTIRMLMGLIQPSQGEIEIFGKDFKNHKNEILPRIGSIIEYSGFYKNLTAYENLKINAILMGISGENAIEEALEIVGLHRETRKKVGKYSLGMKQRLGIARAILHNPELLILDEPTNGLDPVGIKEIRKLIKELAIERGITVFISSHILSEVEQLADRIGVIHKGRLLEEVDLNTLHAKNRKYLEVKVSNSSQACRILETQLDIFDYEVHGEDSLRIYSHLDQGSYINKGLIENHIEVSALYLSEDNLEDYFVRLTGGEDIV